MTRKKIDNFKAWREKMRKEGKIPSGYPNFRASSELAELIGVVLGDGNISLFPRTERLLIVGNNNNQGFCKRYARIVKMIFGKAPSICKIKSANAVRIGVYQKEISKRLGIPSGSRKQLDYRLPLWISNDRAFLLSFLRGLFEAEASLSIHIPTGTYNFQFKNSNASLLSIVKNSLVGLGYHPEERSNSIRLRKRKEIELFRNLIEFRHYQ